MSTLLFAKSKRGNSAIIVDNFKYTRSKMLKSKDVVWSCPKKTCYASITTNTKRQIVKTSGNHKHESLSLYEVNRLILDSELKRKAVEHPTVRPNRLMDEAIARGPAVLSPKDMRNLKRHIYRERRKETKLAAAAVRRLAAEQTRVVTRARGERFVYVEECAGLRRRPVVAVTCATNLRLMCGFLTLYADDAPDRCRARHFGRTCVVHAYKNELYVPLVYLLLPADDGGGGRGRWRARGWRFLAELCRSHGLLFMPDKMRVDADTDARDAVRAVFPECAVLVCRHHLVRAWQGAAVRRPDDDDDDAETDRWLRSFAGLAFLPAAEVPDAFCELIAVAPPGRRAVRFADHVVENYVADNYDPPWPPETWAEPPVDPAKAAVGPARFHLHCERLFDARPSVHELIEVLQNIQTQTYVDIDNIHRPNERHADLCLEEINRIQFVQENYSKYVNGQISRLQFVIMMGSKFDSSSAQEPNNCRYSIIGNFEKMSIAEPEMGTSHGVIHNFRTI